MGKVQKKDIFYADDVVKKLRRGRQLVIFGAGLVAIEVANCLMSTPYGLYIDYFMVSCRKNEPEHVMGVPLLDLESAKDVVRTDALIIVATMGKHLGSINKNLYEYGYTDIIPMTFESDLWSLIQGNYYREYCSSCRKLYLDIEDELKEKKADDRGNEVRIYTAKCHVDRKLKEDISRFSWEIPIQVGAALTDQSIPGVQVSDDEGINISQKNEQYCELTALYWIWKNDTSTGYVGLCHYRRHFELDEEMLRRFACSDIDAVLTIPILNFPSVREVYRHDHVEEDWDIMLAGIHSLAPDYMGDALEIQNGNFYYGYNMFIFRKRILDDYCSWLFPILEYCEKRCGKKDDRYQKRYIGFLAERLLTIYIRHHEVGLKIVHAKKHFIEN